MPRDGIISSSIYFDKLDTVTLNLFDLKYEIILVSTSSSWRKLDLQKCCPRLLLGT
jgi:hypothetical protein